MSYLAPLRKTYAALSPSRSSYDLDHNSDPNEITLPPRISTPRAISRYSFFIRFIIFILLESGYIIFVFVTLYKPVILDLSLTNTEIKGGVTAMAILWHALAVYFVKDILLNVFSAEWLGQSDWSHNLTLQELDIVSRLTSGFLDQVRHCVSHRATHSFRLCFVSFLLLMLLNGLGPSAIGVNLVPYEYPSVIEVAEITDFFTGQILERASAIVQVELMANVATAGFSGTQPNILIPWPFTSEAASGNITMNYDSDVIRYNLSCSWSTPSSFTTNADVVIYDKNTWSPPTLIKYGNLPAIIPLLPEYPSPLIPFLFVHSNKTDSVEDIVPSSLSHCQDDFYNNKLRPWLLEPCPLSLSLLVCNPQIEILTATITVSLASLEATILSGSPRVNNILTRGAYNLFSSSLYYIASPPLQGGSGVSTFSSRMFLCKPEESLPSQPLSLEQISQNMTNALVSSAKAFPSGYIGSESDPPFLQSYLKFNTSAVMQEQKMALVGNKSFLKVVSVIVGVLIVLLGAIVAITRPDELESFDLETILKKFR